MSDERSRQRSGQSAAEARPALVADIATKLMVSAENNGSKLLQERVLVSPPFNISVEGAVAYAKRLVNLAHGSDQEALKACRIDRRLRGEEA